MALTDCTQVTDTIGGDTVRVVIPDTYNAGAGANAVFYFHGAGDSNNGVNVPVIESTVQAWIDSGYLTFSSDAGGDAWGNNTSLTAYINLLGWADDNYNVLDIVGYGGSMGGIPSLLTTYHHSYRRLKGWIGIMPACNLGACHGVAALTASIDTAYGGNYAVNSVGHDPVLLTEAFPAFRYIFFASPDDVVVVMADNTDVFSAIVDDYATENTVVVCSGPHGDPSHFQPIPVSAFLVRAFGDTVETFVFNAGMSGLTSGGGVTWGTGGTGDTIKARLVDAGVTPDIDATTMEGLTAVGSDVTMTGKAKSTDTATNRVSYTASSVAYTALTGNDVGGLVVYKFVTDDAHSIPLACLALVPFTPDGLDHAVAFDADGVFYTQQ